MPAHKRTAKRKAHMTASVFPRLRWALLLAVVVLLVSRRARGSAVPAVAEGARELSPALAGVAAPQQLIMFPRPFAVGAPERELLTSPFPQAFFAMVLAVSLVLVLGDPHSRTQVTESSVEQVPAGVLPGTTEGSPSAVATPPATTVLVAPTGTPSAAPASLAPAPTGLPRLLWGAHDDHFPEPEGLASLKTLMQRDVEIIHWYVQWSGYTDFPTGYAWSDNVDIVRAQHAQGRIPMITWEAWDEDGRNDTNPFPLSRIAAGAFDAYLDEWARGVASVSPGLVYMRPFHEMNITYRPGGYPWNVRTGEGRISNDAATFAAAWRHMHDRFTAAGATNVRWVFNPAGDIANNPFPAATYPGDAYVDFLGWDAYGGNPPPGTMIKDYAIMAAVSPNKPMILGEVSGTPAWVRTELAQVSFPGSRVQAIVWFNEGPLSLSTQGSAPELRALFPSP